MRWGYVVRIERSLRIGEYRLVEDLAHGKEAE
jgi:hypothetical protein